jgi:hypothetical protein
MALIIGFLLIEPLARKDLQQHPRLLLVWPFGYVKK